MEGPVIVIIIIVVIAIIFFLSFYYNSKNNILRRLKKLPFSRIGSLQNHNYSKIEGTALNVDEPLVAPLSRRNCVFYKMKIQKKVSTGKSSHWKTIVEEERIQDFFVEQTGERLLIFPKQNPKNYYDYLVRDKTAKSGTFNDPSPAFRKILNSYNIDPENFLGFNKQLRYEESVIEIGERITVSGYVKWMELEQPVKDYNYSRIATLTANEKNKILITDTTDALKTKQRV